MHVFGRRADGLHKIDTLIAFLDVHDELRAEAADSLSLQVTGPFADLVAAAGGENFVLRAARELAKSSGIAAGARFILDKQVPPGAGLGGGTADGAAAIRLLCQMWGLDLSGEPALRTARTLGVDGPACLLSRTLIARGVGDEISSLERSIEGHLLLAYPRIELATAKVYATHTLTCSSPAPPIDCGGLSGHLSRTRNDLEETAFRLAPSAREAFDSLANLSGVQGVRMTGSGSASFALMESAKAAASAAKHLRRDHPTWWVMPARIIS